MNHHCLVCHKPIPPAEATTYHGKCEDCWIGKSDSPILPPAFQVGGCGAGVKIPRLTIKQVVEDDE